MLSIKQSTTAYGDQNVQEAKKQKSMGNSSKCFLFQQVNTQGQITLLTTKLYLNALQLR